MYHTKKIALYISHIFGDYQKNVCQGVVDQAMEYGFGTEIYATSDGENVGAYGAGEASILRIPCFEDFSGIVFASGTYPAEALKEQIRDTLKACSCPVIEIAEKNTHFPSISLENNRTTGVLTEHLIVTHGFQRICFLGCSSERYFSDCREDIYRRVMAEHALPVADSDVYRCGYQESEILAALKRFTCSGQRIPDAVVCYNDRMALLLMVAAVKEGYRIPEDFALTGCDALPEGQNIPPKLTTVTFPTYELGTAAVRQLVRLMRGEEIPDCTPILAEPLIGESCGCSCRPPEDTILSVHTLTERIADLERSIFTAMRMSAGLSHAADIDDGCDVLFQNLEEIDGCSEFYLCLYPDWDRLPPHLMKLTDPDCDMTEDTDRRLLKLGVRGKKRLPECTFPKKMLLPDYIGRDASCMYIVSPLFFEKREFGYLAVAYENNQVNYHFKMMHWIMIITQLLQNLCEAKSTNRMLARLESVYMRDSLTDLLNRHGCKYRLPKLLKTAEAGDTISALLFDMDGLKEINSRFGHEEGDLALQVIAHTLRRTAESTPDFRDTAVCARFGGDEFILLSTRLNEKTAADFIEQVMQYFRNYNRLNQKPYRLTVTAGSAFTPYRADMGIPEIDALLSEADADMYRKKDRKTGPAFF